MSDVQKRLTVEDDEPVVWICGYPLRLSPKEIQIVRVLAKNECMTYSELHRLISPRASIESVKVCVCSINKKARAHCGRNLILVLSGIYAINRYV